MGSSSSEIIDSETAYKKHHQRSSSSPNEKVSTPCLSSRSSSENNLHVDPAMMKPYKNHVNYQTVNVNRQETYQHHRRKASRRNYHESETPDLQAYTASDVHPDSMNNQHRLDDYYANLKLGLSDFYSKCPADVVRIETDIDPSRHRGVSAARDNYMIPTRDQNEATKGASSMFNPQFLPNFNDMIKSVVRYQSKTRATFFPNISTHDGDVPLYRSYSINTNIPRVDSKQVVLSASSESLDSGELRFNAQVQKCLGLRVPASSNIEPKAREENIYILNQSPIAEKNDDDVLNCRTQSQRSLSSGKAYKSSRSMRAKLI